jgi:hypothetical protein
LTPHRLRPPSAGAAPRPAWWGRCDAIGLLRRSEQGRQRRRRAAPLRPLPLRPRRRTLHEEQRVAHLLALAQRPPTRHRLQAFPLPIVGDLSLTYDRVDLVADAGLTIFTYTAEPGSRHAETFSSEEVSGHLVSADVGALRAALTRELGVTPEMPGRSRAGLARRITGSQHDPPRCSITPEAAVPVSTPS